MALNNRHILWFAWMLFIFIALHAYFDVSTSRQGGVEGDNRSAVHLAVISITVLEGLYVIFKRSRIHAVSYICAPLLTWGIWVALSNILNDRPLSTMLFYMIFIVWWIFTLKCFAGYTSTHYRNYRQIIFIFILLFLMWVWLNVEARQALKQVHHGGYGITMFVYYIVLLTPFIFCIKSNPRRYVCITLACLMVIMSLKRGAIVILPAMIFAYYYTKYKIEGRPIKIVWPTIIFAILLTGIVIFMNDYSDGLLSSRFDSEELESGSGRRELRAKALDAISNRDVLTYLIGSGGGSSVDFLGTGVHNEWIEALFSYGLVGVVIYAWMVIRILRYTNTLIHRRNRFAPYLAMYCAYLLLCTMFSGFMFMHVAFYFWAGIGFFLGLISKDKALPSI